MPPTRRLLVSLATLGSVLIGCNGSTSSTTTELPLAIWSSNGGEADTPERAATAAVRDLLGVTPVLSEFMAGDSRSGEIVVFSPRETIAVERSVLLLRQLGPADEWSVMAAINSAMSIERPDSMSIQPGGPLVVAGFARGFEGLVVVSAHRIGELIALIDQKITYAGSLETSEPFSVELDLSDTDPGDVIAIVVRGGVGLADDPGEFSAIPIRIGP